jgi:hypothetical protein
MTASTFDFATCTPIQVEARADCLLVVGHKAVVFGPVTSVSPTPPGSFVFNFFAIVVQDNAATGDIGNIVPVFISIPPTSCSQVSLNQFFPFLGYPFASGGVTVV